MILNKSFFPPLLVPGVESRSYPSQQVIYHWVISPIPIFTFFFEIDRVSECPIWPWIYDLPVWASHTAGIMVCAPGSSLTILVYWCVRVPQYLWWLEDNWWDPVFSFHHAGLGNEQLSDLVASDFTYPVTSLPLSHHSWPGSLCLQPGTKMLL